MRSSHGGTSRSNPIIDDGDDDDDDSWTDDKESNYLGENSKDYSSDEEVMIRKRHKKKGRKAKLLVNKLLLDQQIQNGEIQYFPYMQNPTQNQLPKQFNCDDNTNIVMVSRENIQDEQRILPNLETVSKDYVPKAFDTIPRGNSEDHLK